MYQFDTALYIYFITPKSIYKLEIYRLIGTERERHIVTVNEIPDWANEAVKTILQTVKLKDPYTFHHCIRVGKNARRFAAALGLSEHDQDILEFSGLLHDVGKLGIPDEILLKPGRLTEEEFVEMKTHAEMSCDVLEPLLKVPFFRFLVPGIKHHHERFDGKGYPAQLSGEGIPLPARIITIIDCFDAITNTRPYKTARTEEFALEEIKKYSGAQFDPYLAKCFLEIYPYWKNEDENNSKKVIYLQSKEAIIPEVLKKAG